MIIIHVVFILIFLSIAKCEEQNEENMKYNYTSLNGDRIDNITEYCKGKRCIAKCCRGDHVFFTFDESGFHCKDMTDTDKGMYIENFTDIQIYKNGIEKETVTSRNTLKNFTFLYNDKFFVPNLQSDRLITGVINYYLLEDASAMVQIPHAYYLWPKHLVNPTDFCIDLLIVRTPRKTTMRIRIGSIMETSESSNNNGKNIYIPVAMLISSFFFALVLIVYGLLPKLRNIVGMVLMAYVANLLVWFTVKAVLPLTLYTTRTCTILSPITYFTILASFFWLNVMSFDIWWTFRGTRKCRDIHRRGELVKFLWYCLYAWGTPLGITIGVVTLDFSTVPAHIVKPSFRTCQPGVYENILFIYIPIIILTVINCILFLLTVYNIWLIHVGMKKFNAKDSQNNKRNENRFIIFIKMSVLMGVGWIAEIVQLLYKDIDSPWLYILINAYNSLLGVAIFFMFVFKKSIFIMLCKRLRIKNKFVTRMESTMSSRNTGMSDSSRKHINRADSETTEVTVTVDLKDLKNMSEVSLSPQ